jgi:tetratricopeptide (TPR) repeat protein
LKDRADNYAQEGNLDKALHDLNRAVALAPKDPWAYFKRGMVQLSLANYKKAVADMGSAIELNPEGPLFYFARGQIYLHHLNDQEKGLADLQHGCRLGHPLCCQEFDKIKNKPR